MTRIKSIVGAFVATITAFASTATLAENWPTKPLRIIVPFNAGSGSDSDSRFYGDLLSKRLGQPVLVENRPGGNGLIAVQTVKSAPADGHTIMLSSNTPMSVNPAIMRKMSYDPFKDFKPLVGSTFGPAAFVIRGDSPHRSMNDVVAAAKQEKRPINIGNYSAGYQLVAAWVGTSAGVEINHINYKGGSQAVTDVIGGQLEMAIVDPSSFVEMHKTGRIRMVATTGAKRPETIPDVPTMMESSFSEFETYVWSSFFVRSDTPSDITNTLIKNFSEVLAMPESVAYRKQRGGMLLDLKGDDLRQFQIREYERFKRVAEAAGLVQ
jgi:tripartite-type tricarboxylate transporter receptor subunit TctC